MSPCFKVIFWFSLSILRTSPSVIDAVAAVSIVMPGMLPWLVGAVFMPGISMPDMLLLSVLSIFVPDMSMPGMLSLFIVVWAWTLAVKAAAKARAPKAARNLDVFMMCWFPGKFQELESYIKKLCNSAREKAAKQCRVVRRVQCLWLAL